MANAEKLVCLYAMASTSCNSMNTSQMRSAATIGQYSHNHFHGLMEGINYGESTKNSNDIS